MPDTRPEMAKTTARGGLARGGITRGAFAPRRTMFTSPLGVVTLTKAYVIHRRDETLQQNATFTMELEQ
jgi:hypothetical protein